MSDKSCYVYLADFTEQSRVLNVFCTVEGYSREQARVHIAEVLNARAAGESYRLLYLGVLDYSEIDEDLVAGQDQYFDKHDHVWILNGSYNQA